MKSTLDVNSFLGMTPSFLVGAKEDFHWGMRSPLRVRGCSPKQKLRPTAQTGLCRVQHHYTHAWWNWILFLLHP